MTEQELDELYGELCRTLARAGDGQAQLLLARFALLAIGALDDAGRVRALIADAGRLEPPREPIESTSSHV
jgi:hypothetical protein